MKQKSLISLISSLKLDWVNSDITEEHFPIQPEDNDSKKEYKVFNFGTVSSEDAIAGMEKEDFRPATLREQLTWAKDNWDRKSWIVALGSRWLDPGGDTHVPVLLRNVAKCRLDLYWFRNDWLGHYSFLGVRKSSVSESKSISIFSLLDIRFELNGKKYKVVEAK